MTEIWRDIGGYDGLYQVSNCGRVKSFHNGERILKLRLDNKGKGYLNVHLSRGGAAKNCAVHRLVAEAFVPNPEGKREVNHIDGNPQNNRVENLEWCTRSENVNHAVAWGLIKSGENSPRAKLTSEQVRYIRDNPDGLTQRQLAAVFGVSTTAIGRIQRGKRYKSVGGRIRTEKPPDPKRIPDEVRAEIRRLYVRGSHEFGCYGLAEKYGLGVTTVKNIIHEN